MLPLLLQVKPRRLGVLCLGAHSDDIEIGCGGTLLTLVERGYHLDLTWVVLSADGARAAESRHSAQSLFGTAANLNLHLGTFQDSHFPAEFALLKAKLGEIRSQCSPDLIFTHGLNDRHQDHRLVAEMTWQTWRDHLILEYEIPKYEGDLDRPNTFVPVSKALASRKVDHLLEHFGSQRSKDWFTQDTFLALMRIRGVECRSVSGLAEAFVARKLVI